MIPSPAKRSRARPFADLAPDEVKSTVDEYNAFFDASVEDRKKNYQSLANHYYNLVTGLYEFAWGRSFHFAPRREGESFKASLRRCQRFIGDRLSLKPGMEVIDLGCGVGGPMGYLARLSGASIVGININAYQIERAKKHTRDVRSLCRFIHGDYMQIPEGDDSYDGAYGIGATCYAPDKTALYREVFRVLRPGACFACCEWCLTEKFDPGNPEHQRIKKSIMRGDGLPDIDLTSEVCDALRVAGFDILETRDMAFDSHPKMPWYRALENRDLSLTSIPRTTIGGILTNVALRIAERTRLLPEGAAAVSTFLQEGGDALVEGGRAGIFTPMFFFLVRKPPHSGG